MARQLGRLGAQASARRAGAGARHTPAERCDMAGAPATWPASTHDVTRRPERVYNTKYHIIVFWRLK